MQNSEPREIPLHIQKQQEFRKIQIRIMYESGRPIYNYIEDKRHIFYKTYDGKQIGGFK